MWGGASRAGSQRGSIATYLGRYLDTNGDGSGSRDATGNYSVTPEIFYIQPPSSQVYRIHRMIPSLVDANGLIADEYGNLGAPLTNGIQVRIQDDSGTLIDLTDTLPVQTNGDWAHLCHDVNLFDWGSGNDHVTARWTFANSGTELRLIGANNERLEVVLNDDFTGLLEHEFRVEGYIE